jgi:cell division protein FtsB
MNAIARVPVWLRVGLVLLLYALISVPFYLKGQEIFAMRAEIKKIQARQVYVAREIERLEALLTLKDDLDYIEYLAKRELGLILPGEEKYILTGP